MWDGCYDHDCCECIHYAPRSEYIHNNHVVHGVRFMVVMMLVVVVAMIVRNVVLCGVGLPQTINNVTVKQ